MTDISGAKIEASEEPSLLVVVDEPEENPVLTVTPVAEDAPMLVVEEAPTLVVEEAPTLVAEESPALVGEEMPAMTVAPVAAAATRVAQAQAHAPEIAPSIMAALEAADAAEAAIAPTVAAIEAAPAPEPEAAKAKKERKRLSFKLGPQTMVAALTMIVGASLVSTVVTVISAHTSAQTHEMVVALEKRQAKMAELEKMVAEVRYLRQTEAEKLADLQQVIAAKPLTADELHAALVGLQASMAHNQSNGGTLGVIRDGQSELAERIGIIYRRLERIEGKLGGARPASEVQKGY